ncbi:c-type cytochrome [Bernardetia sp.]|uniref:c-type cytochrome n=1 Tax=Bernardetia sp. TaxID=1937974 RepID=UPI0025C5B5E5|nr:cytochrome c [Bernardetia sp.]
MNNSTSLYIFIITIGTIIILSLSKIFFDEKMWIEKEEEVKGWYCGTVPTGIDGEILVFDSLNIQQEEIVKIGKELFEGNCAQCHALNKKVVGSALAGVSERWESEEQLIEFIKYPEQIINKNKYAQEMYEEYGQFMPNHDFFDDEQLKSILFYIKYRSGEKVYVELN